MSLIIISFMMVFTEWIAFVECRGSNSSRGRRSPDEIRPGRHEDVDRFDEVYMIVRNTFLLAIAPAVFLFLHGVLKDPDLPFIVTTIWRTMKRKLLGSLSTSSSDGDSSISISSTNQKRTVRL